MYKLIALEDIKKGDFVVVDADNSSCSKFRSSFVKVAKRLAKIEDIYCDICGYPVIKTYPDLARFERTDICSYYCSNQNCKNHTANTFGFDYDHPHWSFRG